MSNGSLPPPLRVHVFVDFWNFRLNAMHVAGGKDPTDWSKLAGHLTANAGVLVTRSESGVRFDGMHIYMSHNPRSDRDDGIRRWAGGFLDKLPGVRVVLRERRIKDAPKCPVCHVSIDLCPSCKASTMGTVEKGIDTALATDMIRLAWEDAYDVAVLVSSDRDFVPVAEFLHVKGRKVIHAAFPPQAAELSQKCWAWFDLGASLREIAR